MQFSKNVPEVDPCLNSICVGNPKSDTCHIIVKRTIILLTHTILRGLKKVRCVRKIFIFSIVTDFNC